MANAQQLVSDARRALVLDHPFFGVLSLKLVLVEDSSHKTLATDGKKLFFNPTYVAALSRFELAGVVAHEVLHCANGHVWRRENRDAKVWNHACDYAINPIVLDAGMVLPKGLLNDSKYKGMSAEEIYAHLIEEPQQSESQDGSSAGQGAGSAGAPGGNSGDNGDQEQEGQGNDHPDGSECGEVLDAPENSSPEMEADWSSAVLSAAKRAEGMGRLPAGIERRVEEIRNPPQDWRANLRRFVQQNASNDYSWRQPNSRFMHAGLYMPALRSEVMPPMVIAIDTSGSIDELIISQFAREIDGIAAEMQPEKVHVVYCDNMIHGVDTFERGEPVTLNPKGFGGTDFRPVFDWVEKEGIQPSCLVYLTDLEGAFPDTPPGYAVLWGSTSGDYLAPPWGEKVDIRCF